MKQNKRGSALIWLLIVLILLAVGIGAYLLFANGVNSIPQPPALPD